MNKPLFDMPRLIYLYEHRDFKGLVDFCNRLAKKTMENEETKPEVETEEVTVEGELDEEEEEDSE